jgi:hypothetical protein
MNAPAAPFKVEIPELDDSRIDALADLLLRWLDDGALDRLESADAAQVQRSLDDLDRMIAPKRPGRPEAK